MFVNWKCWTVLNKKKNYRHNLHQHQNKSSFTSTMAPFILVPPVILSHPPLLLHKDQELSKKKKYMFFPNMVPKVFCFFVLPWRLLFHVFASKNRWVGFLPSFHPVNQVLKKWFRFEICSFFYLRYCPVFPPVFFHCYGKKNGNFTPKEGDKYEQSPAGKK